MAPRCIFMPVDLYTLGDIAVVFQTISNMGLKSERFTGKFCALCFLTLRESGAILYSEKEEKLICHE